MTSEIDAGSFSAELGAMLRGVLDTADRDDVAVFGSVAAAPCMATATAAVHNGDFEGFRLELSPIDRAINGLLSSALPGARDAHFLFRQSKFVERHYRHVIQRVEGSSCCADKARTILHALLIFLTTGKEIALDYTPQDAAHLPVNVFADHAEILDFFVALKRFYYGDPNPYLRVLGDIAARFGRRSEEAGGITMNDRQEGDPA